MKIVLGVLADDVLGPGAPDVGLDAVDPRALADGRTREVRYVAEVLCWLGRRMGCLTLTKEEGGAAGGSAGAGAGSRKTKASKMEAEAETGTVMGSRREREPEQRKQRQAQSQSRTTTTTEAPRALSPHSVASSTGHGSSLLMHSATRSADDSQTTISAFALGRDTSIVTADSAIEEDDEDLTTSVPGSPYAPDLSTSRGHRRHAYDSNLTMSDAEAPLSSPSSSSSDSEDDTGNFCHCPADLSEALSSSSSSLPRRPPKPSIRSTGYLHETSFDDELDAFRRSGHDPDSPRSRRHRRRTTPDGAQSTLAHSSRRRHRHSFGSVSTLFRSMFDLSTIARC